MPRIGAVERFIAEREVGDDIALDSGFEKRPLEPRRVAQMAARDAAVFDAQRSHHIAAETFGKAQSFAGAAATSAVAIDPSGRRAMIWSISARLCSTSRMRIQTRALTSPCRQHRNVKIERIIGRIAGRFPRVEIAAAGAPDIAGRAELSRKFGAHDAGRRCGPAARRCCRKAQRGAEIAVGCFSAIARRVATPRAAKIGRDAAGHDAIHHQAMPKTGFGRAQHQLRAGCRNARA